ncbi:hypothetical protein EIB71_01185 [Kaistella daneshvariae]|jgi:hypothetical protein|uniref:Uncharacterized protein n=1 Tax=Kaistella daneshvariae TaxID=2487074 RepID=A0A3N0WVH6_9FLAO|nr:hypothetical protein [Kaistella daneshvariae]AZI66374.1 hypothetical protein EIB71_01185 [Kaistella daneshvariae]ROI08973.1 hypothetical protein EGI11_06005 [Kaistella daneshvariae]
MNYTIVGLFPSQENIKDVAAGLEKSGIKNQDYLIYKSAVKNTAGAKGNFWKKLLGNTERQVSSNDNLITSVEVRNEAEFANVQNSFKKNKAVKIYEFKDMTIDEAKDLNHIKKMVEMRAKSQIYAMPEISVSANAINEL